MGAFNKRLKLLRQSLKLTQDDLAKALGLSRSAIGMYEQGNREPSHEILELLADFFNVDTDYLLGRSNKTTIYIPDSTSDQTYYTNPTTAKMAQEIFDDPNLRILMDASRDLEPDDLQLVIDMVKRMKKD